MKRILGEILCCIGLHSWKTNSPVKFFPPIGAVVYLTCSRCSHVHEYGIISSQ